MDQSNIAEILNSPLVKNILEKITTFARNKESTEQLIEIFSNINLKELFFVQLGVILFMMVLRSYIFTKVKSFWAHLFAEIWTFAIFICLVGFFVPMYVIGFEYLDVIKILFKAFS